MFVTFFYKLRQKGVNVSPTSFLKLQMALSRGLVNSLEDFYVVARATLIKSERQFDLYDRVFASHFKGVEFESPTDAELTETVKLLLDDWLANPQQLASFLGIEEGKVGSMSPAQLVKLFLERLNQQSSAHHGGSWWIGTGGTSPFGHSGHHPGGMRVGGESTAHSAIKVAMARRYRDYSSDRPLVPSQIGEALRTLRYMVPAGPKDIPDIRATIRQTVRKFGEIEIVYKKALRDKLRVILAIDNGGWSMEPYVGLVQTLFNYARSLFRQLQVFYFHNTIYDFVWEDARRVHRPFPVEKLVQFGKEARFIIVGDASMSPYELLYPGGAIDFEASPSSVPSYERLKFISEVFDAVVWLNPKPRGWWEGTRTISLIAALIPMFELTVEGIEKAVEYMSRKRR